MRSFQRVFSTLGYVKCENGDLEEGFEKIVIFKKNGLPQHAARQLDDGQWTSKIGEWDDISHPLEAMSGDRYGEPDLYMKRPKD